MYIYGAAAQVLQVEIDCMKLHGFIFTIDAVFALIVAAAAVGILLYAHFSEPASFQITSSEALSTAEALAQTPLSASTSLIAEAAANAGAASGSWPYYAQGDGLASSAAYGPLMPQLLFQYAAAGSITSPPSVANGKVVFASGNTIYLLNASTGKTVSPYPIATASNVLYPIFYKTNVIYANLSGYITARATTGNVLWTSAASIPEFAPMTIEDNYIVVINGDTLYLISPTNGTTISSFGFPEPVKPPAYSSGGFFVATSQPGAQNYLYRLVLSGGSMYQSWSFPLTKWNTTNPVVYGNVVTVGSGDTIYGLTFGGNLAWSVQTPTNITGGGGAGAGGYVFYSTVRNIVEVNISSGSIAKVFDIPYTPYNATPAVTPYGVYIFANGTQFMAFPTSNNNMPYWDSYVLSPSTLTYQYIALAYGNAYISGGDTLYAFGTCRGNSQASLLQAVASMYLNGNGGCAALLLNASYNSKNVAILINGTYAPSLFAAKFNGVNSRIIVNSSKKYPLSRITIAGWVNVQAFNSSNGVQEWWTNIQESPTIGLQSYPNTYPGYTSTTFTFFLHNASDAGYGCGVGGIRLNKWYFVVERVNGTNANLTVNNGQYTCNFNYQNDAGYISLPDIGGYALSYTGAGDIMYGEEEGVQMYDTVLTPSLIQELYSEGPGGLPIANLSDVLIGWWPLNGNANDYSGNGNVGYPYFMSYGNANFTPQSLASAYDVGAASFPLPLNTGPSSLYNVSVVVWK